MEIKIEKNIPAPPPRMEHVAYPFLEMEVGDSFFVETDRVNNPRTAASLCGKRHGRKFATRVVTEGGARGVRVWRIE